MACDPAVPDCGENCQGSIGKMYVECDSICLPDGYYFDACKLPHLRTYFRPTSPDTSTTPTTTAFPFYSLSEHGVGMLGSGQTRAEDHGGAMRL
jgi:hypothetical protein